MGYIKTMTKLIDTYLRHGKSSVKIEHKISTERELEAGVPQGVVLASRLFNIFTSNILRTNGTHTFLYAGDTEIVEISGGTNIIRTKLQRALDNIHNWSVRWKVAIDAEKSQAKLIRNLRKRQPEQIIWIVRKYNGRIRSRTCVVKNLTHKKHVDQTKARLKLTLINTIIAPILIYALLVWGGILKSQKKRKQAQYNISLRMAVIAPWYVQHAKIFEYLRQTPVRDNETKRPLASLSQNVNEKEKTKASIRPGKLKEKKIKYIKKFLDIA